MNPEHIFKLLVVMKMVVMVMMMVKLTTKMLE